MDCNKDKVFGWGGVSKSYTTSDFLKDSLVPGIVALVLTCITKLFFDNSFKMIQYVSSLVASIAPTLLSILLAAYAILITLSFSPIGEDLKKNKENGLPLLIGLNASFAMAILVMVLGFIFTIIVGYISKLQINIPSCLVSYINYPTLFLMIYVMIFFIWIIKDITVNIFNIGQYSCKV